MYGDSAKSCGHRAWLLAVLALGLTFLSPGLFGTPVCGLASYATYVTEGQCTLGNFTLTNFSFASSSTGEPTLLSDSQIMVDPTGSTAINLSLQFSADGGFHVNQGQTAEYIFHYNVDPVLPTIDGQDIDLGINDPVTLTGEYCGDGTLFSAPHAQVVCVGSSPTGIFPASLQITGTGVPSSQSFLFPALVTSVDTRIILDLNGLNGPSDAGSLGSSTTISTTPEPSTSLLVMPALLGLLWLRKKRLVSGR
jgi:hypothetical protein